VDSEAEFRRALSSQAWDVILSDFNLPGFSGLKAQEILLASGLLVPFILVSGEIGEDTAVAAMRSGASACPSWRSTCRPAWKWSVRPSPARSMTTWAAA
jgi:DNA-binding NtrC family response regulator